MAFNCIARFFSVSKVTATSNYTLKVANTKKSQLLQKLQILNLQDVVRACFMLRACSYNSPYRCQKKAKKPAERVTFFLNPKEHLILSSATKVILHGTRAITR